MILIEKDSRISTFKQRPLSWSSISSFEYNPEEWYKKYVLGHRPTESPEMIFGKRLALSIEDGTCTVPGLLNALQSKKEHPFKVVMEGIELVGYADAFCDKTFKKLDEVKTGKKAWDQKRVDGHHQITMYALMNYITNKVKPEDTEFTLYWLPTEANGDFSISLIEPVTVHAFKTKRTMKDVLMFAVKIKKVREEMIEYIKAKGGDK